MCEEGGKVERDKESTANTLEFSDLMVTIK